MRCKVQGGTSMHTEISDGEEHGRRTETFFSRMLITHQHMKMVTIAVSFNSGKDCYHLRIDSEGTGVTSKRQRGQTRGKLHLVYTLILSTTVVQEVSAIRIDAFTELET